MNSPAQRLKATAADAVTRQVARLRPWVDRRIARAARRGYGAVTLHLGRAPKEVGDTLGEILEAQGFTTVLRQGWDFGLNVPTGSDSLTVKWSDPK